MATPADTSRAHDERYPAYAAFGTGAPPTQYMDAVRTIRRHLILPGAAYSRPPPHHPDPPFVEQTDVLFTNGDPTLRHVLSDPLAFVEPSSWDGVSSLSAGA